MSQTVGKPPLKVNFQGQNGIAGTTKYKWIFGDTKQSRNIVVYNAVGSKVSSHRIEKGENQIALKASTSGIYLIEIEGAGNQIKWVVE